jgi:tyrosyl-tRNA synthetase
MEEAAHVHEQSSVFDVLNERGFVAQSTDVDELREHLRKGTTCYVGFDPTADSLHIGHLLPILALVHMQRHGHRPIALVGGGTGLVGDPSGKTEMRQMLTLEQIQANAQALKRQLSSYLDFSDGRALLMNNADWLVGLPYIDFLRDIGRHFSVNRMLAAESYKARMETGLNFIEFNYMLLQAFDFFYLFSEWDCTIQMGGNDQWGNIVAGIELIRRKAGGAGYALTFPLLTTAGGQKMGKTAAGAVWLNPEKTSAYDFYQYWINTDDRDVQKFLKLYTFLPLSEIAASAGLEGHELNACKTILAFEVTRIAHGLEEGMAAHEGAGRLFGRRSLPSDLLPSSSIPREASGEEAAVPTTSLAISRLEAGIAAFELFVETGLCSSRSAARRLIEQGGAYLNHQRLASFDQMISVDDLAEGGILLKAGKKKIHRIDLLDQTDTAGHK